MLHTFERIHYKSASNTPNCHQCSVASKMNAFIILACTLLSATAVLAGGYHDYFQPAHYHFAYGVHDPHTKDIKEQHEHRDGHHVKGGYSLHEPDGTKRIVEYNSDPHHGFQALVHREGYAHHPAHYGKHGHGGYGGGHGGTSYVKATYWGHGSGR